jgi:3-deoxy-D-manno-octulosonate 8-phosphate phosphatase KdsC-like HAD superfamily phosphatase
VVALMRAEGMTATVSSIHVNGWYGDARQAVGRALDGARAVRRDLDAQLDRWAYVGDSTNDVRMFQHFAHSIGVANIRRFRPAGARAALRHRGERGAGFAQVVDAILAARA